MKKTIPMGRRVAIALTIAGMVGLCTVQSFAQFSGAITGVVTDTSDARIPRATVTITNLSTKTEKSTTTDSSGNYIFVSLAPGQYQVVAVGAGFAKTTATVSLTTAQTLNLPFVLSLASQTLTVDVVAQAPTVDTVETRNQLTLDIKSVDILPLAGRSMMSLVTMAPGATGKGPVSSVPGSAADNFSTETSVDATANGQGANGNMFVIDGLDVTSNARQGVTSLSPNPDTIQEVSVQTNTYNVDYGRSSSIQMTMTTKSGSDKFHGNASEYYTNNQLMSRKEFTPTKGYDPFHSHNISATIGGPIVPHHRAFFFFGVELLRSLNSSQGSVSIEDPALVQWAKTNFPNTIGTKLLTDYPAKSTFTPTVSQTAADAIEGCGTPAAANIPCNLPLLDTAMFSAVSPRNGNQYHLRLDKDFDKDRIYVGLYRTTVDTFAPQPRPAFNVNSPLRQYSAQLNETHTFSPKLLNEFTISVSRVFGYSNTSKASYIPNIGVPGFDGSYGGSFGTSWQSGEFSQKNLHLRDVLTAVRGSHTLKFGYEFWRGDYEQNLTGVYDTPYFEYQSITDFIQDKPFLENGLAYDPITGAKSAFPWAAIGKTHGLFAEDSWRARKNLTIQYGIRFDDFGNPYPSNSDTRFSSFVLGTGRTMREQIANGSAIKQSRAFNHSMMALSPRVGIAWDPTGGGKWNVRTGAGVFYNQASLGTTASIEQANPPDGPVTPTFYAGQTPEPLLTLGNSNKAPFGYTFPTLPPYTLDSHGGIPGLALTVGSADPNLKPPVAYIWSATVERELVKKIVASIGYSGSHATDLITASGRSFDTYYGRDFNLYPGDLIEHKSKVPTRLNKSFGSINYEYNCCEANYKALIVALRGKFRKGFFSASYTRGSSKDDAQSYPSWENVHQWYGPSVWDIPNRVSLIWNYELPGPNPNKGVLGHIAGGWQLSGTTILQSGLPFRVYTNRAFDPTYGSDGNINGMTSKSGDFNADGDNMDFPNVISYKTPTSRRAYLKGLFKKTGTGVMGYGNFPLPALGQEGNEIPYKFRGPGFAQTDMALAKDFYIRESVSVRFRAESYNLFNRPNLIGMNGNLASGNFGKATDQNTPRWFNFGIDLKF